MLHYPLTIKYLIDEAGLGEGWLRYSHKVLDDIPINLINNGGEDLTKVVEYLYNICIENNKEFNGLIG